MNAISFRVVRHTRNFDRMLHFYSDLLNLTYVHGWNEPNNRGALLSPFADTGETTVELLDIDNLATPDAPPVNLELSIEVADVVAWHDRLEHAGVHIARGLEETPWGHRSFGIDDPDGMRIWLYEALERNLHSS